MKVLSWTYGLENKKAVAFIWVAAFFLLVFTGITYRVLGSQLKITTATSIKLPIPLSDFPKQVGNWIGGDINIPTTTREYMERNFADDYFSRRYVNSAEKTWVDVYVVYCSTRPGGILGHRPGVCYPAHGWLQESTEESQFTSRSGQQIDCLVQKFRQPAPALDEVCVLSFYICNGRPTAKESDFSSIFGRKANTSRDPSRYVAQVQISSVMESSIRKAAQDVTDLVLNFLPEDTSKVRLAEFIRPSDDNVKSTE